MKPNRLKVSVTAEHIAAGKPGEPLLCPVALACGDRFNYKGQCAIDDGIIQVGVWSFDLPSKVSQWIGEFDAERPVEPFSFTLNNDKRQLSLVRQYMLFGDRQIIGGKG